MALLGHIALFPTLAWPRGRYRADLVGDRMAARKIAGVRRQYGPTDL
jgi:hypothetical protein